MAPKADKNMFVGARPTPRSKRAGNSATGKLLPRKCPERSLVPTKTICSRCMEIQILRPDDLERATPQQYHEWRRALTSVATPYAPRHPFPPLVPPPLHLA